MPTVKRFHICLTRGGGQNVGRTDDDLQIRRITFLGYGGVVGVLRATYLAGTGKPSGQGHIRVFRWEVPASQNISKTSCTTIVRPLQGRTFTYLSPNQPLACSCEHLISPLINCDEGHRPYLTAGCNFGRWERPTASGFGREPGKPGMPSLTLTCACATFRTKSNLVAF